MRDHDLAAVDFGRIPKTDEAPTRADSRHSYGCDRTHAHRICASCRTATARAVPERTRTMPTPQDPHRADRTEHPRSADTSPAIARAFALLSNDWNGLILMALAKGPADSAQIRERVPGISSRMLTQRLQELTATDLVTQEVRPGLPSRPLYALSPHGNAFLVPLAVLFLWAEDHLPVSSSPADRPATTDL
ncbi:winged helix-turn-helix transcriptional regulator [Streptomyces sp. 900105755]